VSDGCDLAIHEWRRSSPLFESGSFPPVPFGRSIVVGQNGKRPSHHTVEVLFQSTLSLPGRKPTTAIDQLVPNWRSNGAVIALLLKLSYDAPVGYLRDGRRDDGRVEQEFECHSRTRRPGSRSRMEPKKSVSRPISSGACRPRNARNASPKLVCSLRSMSYLCRESTSATALPRRVSCTSLPASTSSRMSGRCALASATE